MDEGLALVGFAVGVVLGAVMSCVIVMHVRNGEARDLERELVQRGYAEYVAPEPGLPATEFRLIEPDDPQQKGSP